MSPTDKKTYHFHVFQDAMHLDGFIESAKVTGARDYSVLKHAIGRRAAKAGMDPERITIASLTVVGNAQ